MTEKHNILAVLDCSSFNETRISVISESLIAHQNLGKEITVFMLADCKKQEDLACVLADKINVYNNIHTVLKSESCQDKLITFAQFGMCLSGLLNTHDCQDCIVLIYSAKASFLKLENLIRSLGYEVVTHNLKNGSSIISKVTDSEDSSFPHWYNPEYQSKSSDIGLQCITVPHENNLKKPSFIPFDSGSRLVTIGGDSDISLSLWDSSKGLYPSHVEIEYRPLPESRWFIRSLRGVRRGNKAVLVNNKMISAASSYVSIVDGDEITLGGFEFIFKTSRLEELIRYENPESLMVTIETLIKSHVERYSVTLVPPGLSEEVTVQDSSTGGSVWTHAYLRHYGIFIQHNWDHELSQGFRSQFKNIMKFKHDMIKLNGIRNLIMHPKQAISFKDKKFLAVIYLNILECMMNEKI